MSSRRTIKVAITGETSGFTLEDLRYLVEQSADLSGTAVVSLRYDPGSPGQAHQFDRGSAELSITKEVQA